MVLQAQRRGAVKALFPRPAAHEADRQELVHSVSARNSAMRAIEMRAGPELDIFLPVVHPVRQRHESSEFRGRW